MFNVQVVNLAYNRVYIVDSDGLRVLVDTGPDYRGAWETLQEAIAGRAPDVVISTHGHNDHAGLGRQWQEQGVPVALDADDHHLALQPQLGGQGELAAFEAYLAGSGAPEEVRTEHVQSLRTRREWAARAATAEGYPPAGRSTRWPTGIRMAPFQPELIENVANTLADAGLEVIRCPGHTPGNIVVASAREACLFSGDQLLPDITPTPGIQMEPPDDGPVPTRFPSLPAFVRSLQALRERPWKRCYPGHGGAFDDVAVRIDENLSGIEDRSQRIRAMLRDLGEGHVYQVAEALYPRALTRRFWQIIATVQGNLDLLVEEGEAIEHEGVYRLA